jgi:hypothetical protein
VRILRLCLLMIICVLVSTSCRRGSQASSGQMPEDAIEASTDLNEEVVGRAVSLRVLQAKLKECINRNEYPDELMHLCGITRIRGYVVDEQNHDVVLFGDAEPSAPPLHVEDLALALRNAWWMYSKIEGNTRYYSPPYCSIDPDPEMVARLMEVKKRLHRASGDMIDSVLEEWRSTCGRLQKVSVGGILQQTRFASVMVEADYYMKRLVDGSETLSTVKDFTSLTDLTMERLKQETQSGKRLTSPHPFNRFEFYPGKALLYDGEGGTYLRKSEVTLVTEQQFLSTSGKVVGNNKGDPFAEKFAASFTRHYAEIAKEKPIYAELEGLFRHVAIAKALKFKDVPGKAGLDMEVLLGHLPIRGHEVPEGLPGVANLKVFSHRDEKPDGYSEYHLWLPSCGGVQISTEVARPNFVETYRRWVNNVRKSILDVRMRTDQLYWVFKVVWISELIEEGVTDPAILYGGACAVPRV